MDADKLHALFLDARKDRRSAQAALDFFRDHRLDLPARRRAELLWLEQRLVAAVEADVRAEIFHGQAKRSPETPEPLPQGD